MSKKTAPAKDLKPTEAKPKAEPKTKPAAKAAETLIYLGPDIAFTAKHGEVFNDGLPGPLKAAIKKQPVIRNLIVTPADYSRAVKSLLLKEGFYYDNYKILEKEI